MLRSLVLQGLTILVQILVLVAGTFAIKYLRKVQISIEAKIGKENYEHAIDFVKTTVYAIEQQYPGLTGNERFTQVAEVINKKFGNILTYDEIVNLIEAAVKEMNIITGKNNASANQIPASPKIEIQPGNEQETAISSNN